MYLNTGLCARSPTSGDSEPCEALLLRAYICTLRVQFQSLPPQPLSPRICFFPTHVQQPPGPSPSPPKAPVSQTLLRYCKTPSARTVEIDSISNQEDFFIARPKLRFVFLPCQPQDPLEGLFSGAHPHARRNSRQSPVAFGRPAVSHSHLLPRPLAHSGRTRVAENPQLRHLRHLRPRRRRGCLSCRAS